MSSAGYDLPPLSSMQNDSRRASYDRPLNLNLSSRRQSPSPGTSRRYNPYDSYIPARATLDFRQDYPNVYRPVYRTDHSNSYYSRSPSPDRYVSPRGQEPDAWDRTIPWQPTGKPAPWQDRKPLPPSPTSSVSRDRIRRDNMLATRMFEPSETWKQNHVDRPLRIDTTRAPSLDRYPEYRARDNNDISPDRSIRTDRSPGYLTGDRYRPTATYRERESYANGRTEYDSYRPSYDDPWSPPDARDSANDYRRDRSSSRYERSSRRISSPGSIRGSLSPHSRQRSPPFRSRVPFHRSPSRGRRSVSDTNRSPFEQDSRRKRRDSVDSHELPPQKKARSRSSSRSSIASTHVSDKPLSRHSSIGHPIVSEMIKRIDDSGSMVAGKGDIPGHSPPCPVRSPSLSRQDHVADQLMTKPVSVTCSVLPDRVVDKNSQPVNSSSLTEALPVNGIQSSQRTFTETRDAVQAKNISKGAPFRESEQINGHGSKIPLPSDSTSSSIVNTPLGDELSLSTSRVAVTVSQALQGRSSTYAVPPSQRVIDVNATHREADSTEPTSGAVADSTAGILEQSLINGVPGDIPCLSDAKTTAEALRIIVMTRLLCDRQTREERINPVLMANLTLAPNHDARFSTTSVELLAEVARGQRLETRLESFTTTKQALIKRFEEHQASISAKAQRLKEEYLILQERWLAHCASLDEQSKPVGCVTEPETSIQPLGRTTRRSTAIGDAVRSDLEMEQIIASLGIDEATDPNQLSVRNLAKIPDMISTTCGQVDFVFDDTNHLVDNPSEYFGPHTGIHDWTEPEKEIFLNKFAAYPKQFGIIADFLPNKTATQCVDYYYLHKRKFIDFRLVVAQYAPNKRRRRRTDKKKGNGLLADIRQHDAEVYRDSESPSLNGRPTRTRRTMAPPESRKPLPARRTVIQGENTPLSTPTPEPEARPRRRRAAPISRTVSLSLDDGEEEGTDVDPKPVKRAKRVRKVKSAAMINEEPTTPFTETRFIDQNESSSRRKVTPVPIQWSDQDKYIFLALLAQHGDDFKRIAASMPNKTTIQVSNYYKSNLVELNLDKVAASAPKRSPTPEQRESWKELPFPGTGIMSPTPSTGSHSASAPGTSSHNVKSAQTSARDNHGRSVSRDVDSNSDPTWRGSTARDTVVPSNIRTKSLAPSKHSDVEGVNGHPLSPNLPRIYPKVGYPASNGQSINGSYPSSSAASPVSTSTQPRPYVYPQFSNPQHPPYDPRLNQSLSPSFPEPHAVAHRRSSGVTSLNRENPYPVLPSHGSAASQSFFIS